MALSDWPRQYKLGESARNFLLLQQPSWSAPGGSRSQNGDFTSSISFSRPPVNRMSPAVLLQDRHKFTKLPPRQRQQSTRTQNAYRRRSDFLNPHSSHIHGTNRRRTARSGQLKKISSRWRKIPGQSLSLRPHGCAKSQARDYLAHYWENGDWYGDRMKRAFICCRWDCSRILLRVRAHFRPRTPRTNLQAYRGLQRTM